MEPIKPTIGRIVHYVQDKPAYLGGGFVHLPAIIVAVWTDTCVNLQVFTDGSNSEGGDHGQLSVKWMTSVTYDETASKPRTWHWPETS